MTQAPTFPPRTVGLSLGGALPGRPASSQINPGAPSPGASSPATGTCPTLRISTTVVHHRLWPSTSGLMPRPSLLATKPKTHGSDSDERRQLSVPALASCFRTINTGYRIDTPHMEIEDRMLQLKLRPHSNPRIAAIANAGLIRRQRNQVHASPGAAHPGRRERRGT